MADAEEHGARALPKRAGRTGRPVDRSKDATILTAALDALAGNDYDQVTVDAIAASAGTAKTTIYRRWPTKIDLVLAAIAAAGRPPEADLLPDRGSLRADLLAIIDSPWLGGPEHRLAIFAGLASAARTSTDLADTVRTQITEPYVETYRALLQRAADRGLLPERALARIALVAEVVPALTSRAIAGSTPTGRDYAVSIVDDVVLPALGLR